MDGQRRGKGGIVGKRGTDQNPNGEGGNLSDFRVRAGP